MKRHAWRWGAVAGVVGLALWFFASRGAPESSAPGGQGPTRESHAGSGAWLQGLLPSAPVASGDASLRIRGRVLGPRGPVAGVQVLASAGVARESLSELPCREEATETTDEESALDCYPAGQLAAFVTQRLGESPVLARATSEADGSFSLEALKAGHYALWAEGSEGVGLRWDVVAGDEGVELLLGEGVRVSGRVTDEDQAPVAGALVTAIYKAHSRFFETVTDGAGRFLLGPLPRGEYVLLASKEGLLPTRMTFTGYVRRMERDVPLFRPRRLAGQVVRAGAPVAGVRVSTWSQDDASERQVFSDAAGRFSLEGLHPGGSYELIASRDALWANTRVDFTPPEEQGQYLPDRTDLLLELAPVVEVKGVVRDEAGKPLAGAMVELSETVGEEPVTLSAGWTDDEGRYHLGPAKPGRLRLDALSVDRLSRGSHEATFPAGTSSVDLVLRRDPSEEGVEEVEAEEVLSEDSSEDAYPPVVGEVVDELDVPVPDVEVSLWSETADGTRHRIGGVRTNAVGSFALLANSEGRYRVIAEFHQEDVVHAASQEVELGREGTRVRLRFAPGREVSGVVVDTRGRPVEGAQVELRSALGRPSRSRKGPGWGQRTGPDGRFTFQSVSGEPLELTVEKPEHVLACAEREDGRIALPVKPGDRELRVVLLRSAYVTGRFLQKDGTPIPMFGVNTREGLEHVQGWSDEEGRFFVPIRCTGTIQFELIAADNIDVRGGPRRLRRSVSVREEVDLDLGALRLDGQ